MVSCTIDQKGDVPDAVIERASNPTFDRPALAAVKKWKFNPRRARRRRRGEEGHDPAPVLDRLILNRRATRALPRNPLSACPP
jgi:hypothetical protein